MAVQTQTFVVRIYQPYGGLGRDVVGVVEIVRSGRKLRFVGFDELRAILVRRTSPQQKSPIKSR